LIKIGATADIHAAPSLNQILFSIMNSVADFFIQEQIDLYLDSGDVFEFSNISKIASVTSATTFETVATPYRRMKEKKIKLSLVSGNHDKGTGKNLPATHFFVAEGIEVNNKIGLSFYDINNEKLAIINVPWLRREEQERVYGEKINLCEFLISLVKQAKKETNNIIANMHINIVGAKENNYTAVDTDFELTQTELQALSEKGVLVAFLGHIHKRQTFIEGFSYTGSLFQRSFRECNNPSGFRYVELSDGKVITDKFIDINVPEYIQIEVKSLKQLEQIIANQENLFNNKLNHYRLKIYDEYIPNNIEIAIPGVEVRHVRPQANPEEARTSKSAQEIATMKEEDYIELYCSEVLKLSEKEQKQIIKFYKEAIKEFSL